MPKYITLIISLLAILSQSCKTPSHLFTNPDGKQIDRRLIGHWHGNDHNSPKHDKFPKNWDLVRYPDGSYYITFTYMINEVSKSIEQKGYWWIEKDKFYERNQNDTIINSYEYSLMSENEIKFKSTNRKDNKYYSFSDFKK